jgi:hypothetical protein
MLEVRRKMNQIYIKNLSGSIFKIPFKLNTPYEVQAKVNGVVGINKGVYIPPDVAMFIDMARLERYERNREIKFQIKKTRVPRLAVKPSNPEIKVKPKPKEDKVKVDKDKEEKDKKEVKKGGS